MCRITVVVLSILLISCERKISQPAQPGQLDLASTYAARATLNGDTIRLADGTLALIQCRCDTVRLVEENARPLIITGTSTVIQWPDTSFRDYNVVKIGKGGYSLADMRGITSKTPINWDSLIALNPKQWILQGVDNDILYKRKLTDIQADFKWIVDKIITSIPDIRVEFLYAKPTQPNKYVIYPSGENGWTTTEYFNRNMAVWGTQKYPQNFFPLDTYAPMILWNPKRINTTLYKSDTVHLNANGYKKWDAMLRPRLITGTPLR